MEDKTSIEQHQHEDQDRELFSFDVDEEKQIKESFLAGTDYPIVLEPNVDDIDIFAWVEQSQSEISEHLEQYGAILFRGFELGNHGAFERFSQSACGKLIGNYADLPEEDASDFVYGSTPYPENKTIYFHNESSHLNHWPLRQFFVCVTPSKTGGETPIMDSRKAYRLLPSHFVDKCKKEGLLYVRNFIRGLDISWQEFFKTDSTEEVEARCRLDGMTFVWGNDERLTISKKVAAIKLHPSTGENIFFNQIQLHHPYFLSEAERDSLLDLYGEEGFPRNVFYGDGSVIENELAKQLYDIYNDNCVKFRWKKGDLLMVDNMLVAHARLPFSGERKMLVALGDIQHLND